MFVIDSSISIILEDYAVAKNLIYTFTKQLDTSVNNSIGIILIGTEAIIHQPLGVILTMENRHDILRNVNATPHLGGFTNTADGLCKLTNQQWRNDSGVLQLAFVLTDGRSNYDTHDCGGGDTEYMADLIHSNYPQVLVFAVGVGEVNTDELSLIASRSHLVTKFGEYVEMNSTGDTLRYQICSTCV